MSREELLKKSKKELMEICKNLGVTRYSGKTALKNEALIENILYYYDTHKEESEPEEVNEPINESCENVEVKENEDKSNEVWDMSRNKDKTKNIEEAEVGTLMCFIDLKGKPRTAKLVNRSSKRREVKLITEFEWEFVVPYENVLWVRKEGTKWPRGIYNLLKGYSKNVKKDISEQTAE